MEQSLPHARIHPLRRPVSMRKLSTRMRGIHQLQLLRCYKLCVYPACEDHRHYSHISFISLCLRMREIHLTFKPVLSLTVYPHADPQLAHHIPAEGGLPMRGIHRVARRLFDEEGSTRMLEDHAYS